MKPVFVLICTLTLTSTWYLASYHVFPNVDARVTHINNVLSGQPEYATYQYRIFQPVIVNILQIFFLNLTGSLRSAHIISSLLITLTTFFGIFSLFYVFLRNFFEVKSSLLGLLLLQVIIPLTVTGTFIEGDFIALLFYLVLFNLMIKNKDIFLPLVLGLASLNREQMIFFVVFYIIFLLATSKILNKKYILITLASIIVYLLVFFGLRVYLGPVGGSNVAELVWINNTNPTLLIQGIFPLYLVELGGFIILSFTAFAKSSLFFKLSFLSLGVYFVAFFFNGYLQELAKFLPAFLILIPMSLQQLTGEFVRFNKR